MTKFNFLPQPIHLSELQHPLIDIRLATPEANFGSHGLARELNEIFEDAPKGDVIWQPDVYAEARVVADSFGIKRIIDIGCGNGTKLVHYFPQDEFQTIGLDFRESIKLARAMYPVATWVTCDLNLRQDLAQILEGEGSKEPVLLILSDVIEHLPDPRQLMAQLRSVLMRHTTNKLVLSTPDRSRSHEENYVDKPKNAAHIREWTLNELAAFCCAAGFQIDRYGYTRANQFDDKYSTIYIQLRCLVGEYMQFLQSVGLLYDSVLPNHLIMTSEYSGLHRTGGIGSFVVEQRLAYGIESTLCLFIGSQDHVEDDLFSQLKLLRPNKLLADIDLSLPAEEVALKATQQLLFYFPEIRKLEYADYQGLGCRLAQAKRASLLPSSIELIVHCHGATHYLENANQTWFGRSHLSVAEREKISIECADKIVFPTKFLFELYREVGFDMPANKVVFLRYPYHFTPVKIEKTEQVDTLVFFGKRSTMKGYPIFLSGLASGGAVLASMGVKKIVFIGPKVFESEEEAVNLNALRAMFEVEEFASLGRTEAMDKLSGYASRSVCVMPYLGDNHPLALLDVVFAGVLPVMLRAGGVGELFLDPFDKILLAEQTDTALVNRISELVGLSIEERHSLRVNFLEKTGKFQRTINEEVRQFGESYFSIPKHSVINNKATVIVPVFNTDLIFIAELVFGLNNQSMPPAEVIFIDDASESAYACKLEFLLSQELKLPYRVIRHSVNKGLAGARNTGLYASNTDYVINVDSDDIPLTDFVRNIVMLLDSEPSYAAAVPYLKAFQEDTDFNTQVFGGYIYRPLGEGVISSLLDNNLGHANSGYRVSVIRELGGWDQSEKSMWEDWALYLRIVSSGYRIGIIPRVDCLYRVRKQSMLRTYAAWPAMRRLARNMKGLSRFENFRLQAMMRQMSEEEGATRIHISSLHEKINLMISDVECLRRENSLLTTELNRRSVRAVRIITANLLRYPSLFGFIRFFCILLWRATRRARNLVGLR